MSLLLSLLSPAGQWIHIRATWNNSLTTDTLKLYVDGTRVDGGAAGGVRSLGGETTFGSIFVGYTVYLPTVQKP